MQCYVCGNFFDDNQQYCPVCGAMTQPPEAVYYEGMPLLEVQPQMAASAAPVKQKRRKPHIALRIGMQLLSFLLCLVLCVMLVATVVVADLNLLTSSGGIKQVISALLLPGKAPQHIHPMVGAGGVPIGGDLPIDGDIVVDDDMKDVANDILSAGGDTNALVDVLYKTMQDMLGEETNITKEQLQTFVEESTITEYISEKAAGYAEDILSGTENTVITSEELVQLVEENKTIIEESFNITITEEQMEEIKTNVTTIIEEQDINTTIRTEINNVMESATSGAADAGIPLAEIMAGIRLISQDSTLYGFVGACVVLLLLLCATNFYNIPGGLTWASFPCMIIGGILAAPIAVVQTMPEILGELASLAPLVNVFAPIHYAVPLIGVALLVISIVWRIVRSCIRNSREAMA